MNPIESSSSHSSRPRVLDLISMMPGIHLRELCRLLGLSFTSTRYHVDKLCSAGTIVREREGGHVRLFPVGIRLEDKIAYSFLRTKRFRDILTALAEGSHLSSKEICSRTKLPKSTVSKCIHELVEVGLVKDQPSVKDGTVTYQICDPEYLLRVLMNAHKSSELQRTNPRFSPRSQTERFIDLWDF